ncbi:hypothetical protein HELRODRAFT_174179 [Helobdella robusta]|uniref:Uncharacterized protein n=1 Tax=Helobdella robusta TaxID=6412 RepID=T1F7Q9_HELRO|nr:hypothetical protein HELRODRAFT_174179 [Helobdella robusta]ESO02770.1 hypothetical protein HELRODRAFT_174179 [Helobdella robusta]
MYRKMFSLLKSNAIMDFCTDFFYHAYIYLVNFCREFKNIFVNTYTEDLPKLNVNFNLVDRFKPEQSFLSGFFTLAPFVLLVYLLLVSCRQIFGFRRKSHNIKNEVEPLLKSKKLIVETLFKSAYSDLKSALNDLEDYSTDFEDEGKQNALFVHDTTESILKYIKMKIKYQ